MTSSPRSVSPASAPSSVRRRSIFAGAAAIGAAAAVLPVVREVEGQPAVQATPEPVVKPERGGGYHASAHVEHYYKTARV